MTANVSQHSPHPSQPALLDTLLDQLADRIVDRLSHHDQEPAQDSWLTLAEAAKYLSLHPDTLRKHAKAGRMPYEQEGPGCRMYFRGSELDAWRYAGGAPVHLAHVADLSARRSKRRR